MDTESKRGIAYWRNRAVQCEEIAAEYHRAATYAWRAAKKAELRKGIGKCTSTN